MCTQSRILFSLRTDKQLDVGLLHWTPNKSLSNSGRTKVNQCVNTTAPLYHFQFNLLVNIENVVLWIIDSDLYICVLFSFLLFKIVAAVIRWLQTDYQLILLKLASSASELVFDRIWKNTII